MRLRNGEGVVPGAPQDLPAEVFFLTYKKEKPISTFISSVLNSDDMISSDGNGDNYHLLSLLKLVWQLVSSNINGSGNSNNSNDSMMNNGIESFYNPLREMDYRGGKRGGRGSNGPDIYF